MSLNTFRQIFLPYCIVKNDDGSFSILNREYSDLGEASEAHAPSTAYRLKGIGPATLDKIAIEPSTDGRRWYLYNDGCLPDSGATEWKAYSARLWKLREFEMKDAPRDRANQAKSRR